MSHKARQWPVFVLLVTMLQWWIREAHIFMISCEALHHRLEVVIKDGQVFGMLLHDLLPLLQKRRRATGRRHIDKQELASIISINPLNQLSIPCNQPRSKLFRVRAGIRIPNTIQSQSTLTITRVSENTH